MRMIPRDFKLIIQGKNFPKQLTTEGSAKEQTRRKALKLGFMVEGELEQAVAATEIQFVADIQPVIVHGPRRFSLWQIFNR
jgi:hypothetical protein